MAQYCCFALWVLAMQVKFYTNSNNLLWDNMRYRICYDILNNLCGERTPRYYIHFDKMYFNIGWFTGFVEIWKGKKPHEKNHRRIPFTVHVIDWGGEVNVKNGKITE